MEIKKGDIIEITKEFNTGAQTKVKKVTASDMGTFPARIDYSVYPPVQADGGGFLRIEGKNITSTIVRGIRLNPNSQSCNLDITELRDKHGHVSKIEIVS